MDSILSRESTSEIREPETAISQQLSTVQPMARTEVHTLALSLTANAILSLFPCLVLLLTFSRLLVHSRAMQSVAEAEA